MDSVKIQIDSILSTQPFQFLIKLKYFYRNMSLVSHLLTTGLWKSSEEPKVEPRTRTRFLSNSTKVESIAHWNRFACTAILIWFVFYEISTDFTEQKKF